MRLGRTQQIDDQQAEDWFGYKDSCSDGGQRPKPLWRRAPARQSSSRSTPEAWKASSSSSFYENLTSKR
eukprot:7219128-Heterocapsa_arctica.AAC.1